MRKKSLGEVLRDARTEKGFSLYDVESMSGIEVQYLLALEMDQLKALPEELQKKSLEQYASVVGLDGEGLYREQLESELQDKKTKETVEEQMERDLEAKRILSRFSKHKREEKRKSAYLPLLIMSTLSLLIILSVGYIIYRHLSNQSQVINSSVTSAVKHESSSLQTSLSHSVSEVTVSGVNVTKNVQGKTLSLRFSNLDQPVRVTLRLAKDNSQTWLSISDTDSSENLLLSEGGQKTIDLAVSEATKPTLMTIGQASQIELTLNGQPIDLSELSDDTLSYITLTVQ